MEDLHRFNMPPSLGGYSFGIRELSVDTYASIHAQAAKRIKDDAIGQIGHMLAVTKRETDKMMRLSCLAEWDGRVLEGEMVHEALDGLNVRQMQLLDRAIDLIHSLTPDELESFERSHRMPGAVATSK